MKRFYDTVSHAATEGGFEILLDGRAVKTPAKNPLICKTENLAEAVAEEWRQVKDVIKPENMAVTGFINAAIDRIAPAREDFIQKCLDYAEFDTLCYRLSPDSGETGRKQAEILAPAVEALEKRLDAKLNITTGLEKIEQSSRTLQALRDYVSATDHEKLTAFYRLAGLTDSAFLTLLVFEKIYDAETAFTLSRTEIDLQAKRWGETEEFKKNRTQALKDVTAVGRFLNLLWRE